MSGRRANFLDFVPRKRIESRTDPEGGTVLLLPKFGSGRLGRWWSSVVGEQRAVLKIHLDDLGERTWNAIDGQRTIGDIADELHVDVQGSLESRYERCSRFIKMLANAGAVDLEAPDAD